MMKIEDNYLGWDEFTKLQSKMMGTSSDVKEKIFHLPWYYLDYIDNADDEDKFQFIHVFYHEHAPVSPCVEVINPIMEKLEEKLKQWTTSIFYMNTNNGYTIFENGTKVESVANRMITFPANIKHTGTSCTDEKTRVVINFNYFSQL